MKVIVTAGGTGGHIYPALGVIEELESIGAEILYIGTKNRLESTLIPEKGINYVGLEIYGLSKTNILRDIKNVGYIIKSYNTCKKIMKEFKPDYVIGFGGYVTLPVLLAAKNAKIRCGIHEQNKLPGKTNKFLSKYVDETFTSFEVSDKTFKNKVIVTGNPTGSKALNIKPADKTKLGFSKDKKLTIIVMGSLGSQIVNNLLKDFLTNYKNSDNEILFITGKSNYENFKDISVSKNIKIIPYYDDLSSIMKVSDLVISRAGASTISEILSLNKPSILIPSPYVANNHQYYNALELKEKGLSYMIEQKDLTTKSLNTAIDYVFTHEKEMITKLKKQPKLDASKLIVEEILK